VVVLKIDEYIKLFINEMDILNYILLMPCLFIIYNKLGPPPPKKKKKLQNFTNFTSKVVIISKYLINYCSTLATSAQITLFLKMLKFSPQKIIYFCEANFFFESFGIFLRNILEYSNFEMES
jgi:hypothetical protein